jgi:hypothetical protein
MYRGNMQAMMDQRIRNGKFIRLPPELKEQLRTEFD